MYKERSNIRNITVQLPSVLTIVFIVLKLTHYIDWSWWYVTMPLWGSMCALVIGFAAFCIVGGTQDYLKNKRKK